MICKTSVATVSLILMAAIGLTLCQDESHEDLHPQNHRRHHRHNTDTVFWQKIGDQVWSADYGNPCQSGPNDFDDESFDLASMVSSLSVENREETLRAKAGHLLARLRHLERFVPMGECTDEKLTSLPDQPMHATNSSNSSTFSEETLERLYASFLYVSVHYRFMAQDWELGRACFQVSSRRQAIIESFTRNGQEFEHGMCMLLAPVTQGSPYPNAAVQARVYNPALHREVLHYVGDCAGRVKRDCIVHRYAETMLQRVLDATTKMIQRRRTRQA